jgi:hypothetical protein
MACATCDYLERAGKILNCIDEYEQSRAAICCWPSTAQSFLNELPYLFSFKYLCEKILLDEKS